MERDYECKTCSFKSKNYADLMKHIKSVHVLGSFQCRMCGEVFSTKYSLKSHKETNHVRISQTIVQCQTCENTFKHSSLLNPCSRRKAKITNLLYYSRQYLFVCFKCYKMQVEWPIYIKLKVGHVPCSFVYVTRSKAGCWANYPQLPHYF